LKVGALFSGGKDSTYALYWALQNGFDVECLLTVFPLNPESYLFHTVNIWITGLQAEAIGLPHLTTESSGEKEKEVLDLERLLKQAKSLYGIKGIVSGAVASEYQKRRIEQVARKLDLISITPLWGKSPENLLLKYIESGFEIMITGVFALGFDSSWLGSMLTEDKVAELLVLKEKYGVNPVGEGGEYETTVLYAPFFKKRIIVEEYEKEWYNYWGILCIKKATVVDK